MSAARGFVSIKIFRFFVCVRNAVTWVWITFLISWGSAFAIQHSNPSDQQTIQKLCMCVCLYTSCPERG